MKELLIEVSKKTRAKIKVLVPDDFDIKSLYRYPLNRAVRAAVEEEDPYFSEDYDSYAEVESIVVATDETCQREVLHDGPIDLMPFVSEAKEEAERIRHEYNQSRGEGVG